MTGTPSRTATASSRGGVGRKLKAKPRPEVHESHLRRPNGGRGGVGTRSPMSPGSADVYAAGVWGEGHASYPGRSANLPDPPAVGPCSTTGVGKPETTPGLWAAAFGAHGSEQRSARTERSCSEDRLVKSQGETRGGQKSAEAENHGVAWERAEHEEPNRCGAFDA